jgi:hypothetical protein
LRFDALPPRYLAEKLTEPLPTKDGKNGRVLRTIADARDYMLALPEKRAIANARQHCAPHRPAVDRGYPLQTMMISFQSGTILSAHGLNGMFFFYSNRVGLVGSIVLSIGLTLLLVYACAGP